MMQKEKKQQVFMKDEMVGKLNIMLKRIVKSSQSKKTKTKHASIKTLGNESCQNSQ